MNQNVLESSPRTLAERVFTWACVFRKVPVKVLEKSLAGMLVIDPDSYSLSEVERLQKGGRLVIAYLSIGEAEEYRQYFSHPDIPDIRLAENKDWKGNFRVAYWDSRWRSLLEPYVTDIMAKGFDGLFLDVVDAWEDHPASITAKTDMSSLICALADKMRLYNPSALMLLQNSHQLFDDPDVFKRCDGLSNESLYASWAKEKPSPEWLRQKREALAELRQRGKFIGLIEYTRNPGQMAIIKEKALLQGLIPYFTTKQLDRLFPIP